MKVNKFIFALVFLFQLFAVLSRADIGVILYENTGQAKREINTGHIAIVAPDLCNDNYFGVRACSEADDENHRGVVISRYSSLLPGGSEAPDFMVMPMKEHFYGASSDSANSPLENRSPILVSGAITKAAIIDYWEKNLKDIPQFQPLSEAQIKSFEAHDSKFSIGKIFDYVFKAPEMLFTLGKKSELNEKYAMFASDGKTLIPNGHWTLMYGSRHRRSSTVFIVETPMENEIKLIGYLKGLENRSHFSATNNCADFANSVLKEAFDHDSDFNLPKVRVADLYLTSPLAVATGLVRYAKKNHVDYSVYYMPQISGTRELSSAAQTVSKGTLVADPDEGRLSYIFKAAIAHMQVYLPISAELFTLVEHPVDPNDEVQKRNDMELSALQNELADTPKNEPEQIKFIKTTIAYSQLRSFGSKKCWESKKKTLKRITEAAKEANLINAQEASKVLKGSGKSLPQLLEKEGMKATLIDSQIYVSMNDQTSGLNRENILGYRSDNHLSKELAFKIVLASVNYYLSSDPDNHLTTKEFDAHWNILLNVASDNGINFSEKDAQPVSECSTDEFSTTKIEDIRTIDNKVISKPKKIFRSFLRLI